MEMVGWGFEVKSGEGAAGLGRRETPVFPLERVQSQKE